VAHWNPLPHPFHDDSRPGLGTAGAGAFVAVAVVVGEATGLVLGVGVGVPVAWSEPPLQALSSRTGSSRAAARRGRREVGRTVAFWQ
jgi:hypothetical protein